MAYYIDTFSPDTYESFSKSDRTITGFGIRQKGVAERIKPGDKFVCYMTKLSRWIGMLEVTSESFIDKSPRFYEADDPYIVRFKVNPIVWFQKDKAIPIREDLVWNALSFTKLHDKKSKTWTGKFRVSPNSIEEADGEFLENLLLTQKNEGKTYPIDEEEFDKHLLRRVRRQDREIGVSIPVETEEPEANEVDRNEVRQSAKIQTLLAQIGNGMGFNIWLPRNDRRLVLREWHPEEGTLLERLPLNYDEVTLRTIEQIDVLWLKNRSIVRAFEVEHTTSIYSGILRMADLLALQPNMDIKLHIVAPAHRRDKVFQELRRPVFSLLEKAPLFELCTFLPYESIEELAAAKHLHHLTDTVLEDYAEVAD